MLPALPAHELPARTQGKRASVEPLMLDPFATIRSEALRVAAVRVAHRWSNQKNGMVATQDVVFELLELTRVIERGEAAAFDTDTDSATLVLRSRLLQELRNETVREWSSPSAGAPSADAMLAILHGFRQAESLIEPASADALAKRLSDPGSLGLVVEVAHDLRSPLTSILFLSEAILRGASGELNEVQRRQLSIIYSAALGMINIASDVVEMARGNEPGDEPVPLSLACLMEPVREIVQPMAEEKGVEVRVYSMTPDQRIGMPVALSRVLLNLTTNALKFTSEGFIEIAARQVGSRVEFSVRDTGSGIDPDALATLFHPFRRRTGPRPGYYFSGTGLGLTICRKLVESMGGELRVESRSGWGTRFFFEIDLPPA